MTDKPSRGAPLIVIITLLLLPLGYLGSYAALADTSGQLVMGEDSICCGAEIRQRAPRLMRVPVSHVLPLE